MSPLSGTAKGVVVSLAASCLFGLMYYYATLLGPLGGLEIFGWRTLSTLPFLSLFMIRAGLWPLVTEIADRVRRNKLLALFLALSSFLVGVQFWLFLWAPVNGRALEVSLGYLLMPLVMVVCGRMFFKELLLPYQKLAVAFAALGVGNQIYRIGGISWEVLLVALGFPVYFTLRRRMGTDHLGGLWFDILLMIPAACLIISGSANGWGIFLPHPEMAALIPMLGVLSATAVGCYILASRYLPLGLFGLLSYVEPVLLVVVSLILGERIHPQEYLTYIGVGLAVGTLALGGLRRAHPEKRP